MDLDVPAIHSKVRERIEAILKEIHHGQVSQLVILTGSPGMGKTHLINCFRSRQRAEDLRYELVCNSNHWKPPEFEACLLQWILDALVYPSPDEPHRLLERIKDIAFQALRQIVDRPGEIEHYKRRSMKGFFSRLRAKLTGAEHGQFLEAIEKRDISIFRSLEFGKFAGYVCKRFLLESNNCFHRHVMHVLLRYLFVEDREKVLHWLRRKPVHDYFLRKLGMQDEIDHNFKIFDVIKILVSLFTPDVSAKLKSVNGAPARPLVFFFAFDQSEAREALFETPDEWRKFFAQLSELYNALPNVFILFTMTIGLRDKYIATMEGQFRDRIRQDPNFILTDIESSEVLALYYQRINRWLGEDREEVVPKLDLIGNRYMPLDQKRVLELAQKATLRDTLRNFDIEFRKVITEVVIGPQIDFQTYQKEFRKDEETIPEHQYIKDHLETVKQLLQLAGHSLADSMGIDLVTWEDRQTDTNACPVLRVQFCSKNNSGRWFRIFLVRLPFTYNDKMPECIRLLANLQAARYQLWPVRARPIDPQYAQQKPGQIFDRVLIPADETNLKAAVEVWKNRDDYSPDDWVTGEAYLLSKIKATYLGELLDQVRQAIAKLDGAPELVEATEAIVEPKS